MEADEIERLLVRVEANAVQFEGQMKRINKALYGSAAETRKTLNQIKRDWDRAGRDLSSSVVVPIQMASTIALGAIIALSTQAAKRAEAVDGAFKQIFRDMPQEAQAAVTKIADEFGRLETDIKDNFAQLRSVLTALGVDAEQSLAIVDQLQRRALDIGAFANVSDADAFRAVISGITGETEPLKKFGVVVNETATKAELLRLGFKGNATQAPEAAKAIARANIILRQSAEMHGQVAREADQLAEQEKRTRAEFTKAAEDFGRKFLPVAKDVLVWATAALDAFNDLDDGTKAAGLGMLALVAASGPIAAVVKGLKAIIGAAAAARAALMAVPATGAAAGIASAAGGAAAGAAARGGLGAVGAGAAAVTLPLMLSGDSGAPDLDQTIAARERALARQRDAGLKAEIQRDLDNLYQLRAQRLAELESVAARSEASTSPTAGLDAAARAALEGLGDFGLSDAQKMAVGGAKGGASGPSSTDLANRREALALEKALAIAQATGSEAAVRAEEERQELIRLTQDYQDAGYEDAAAQALEHLSLLNAATIAAEEREAAEREVDLILEGRQRQLEREAEYERDMADQLMDRLSYEAELAALRGDQGVLEAKQRELWIEGRINQLLTQRKGLTKGEARDIATGEADAIDDATAQGRFRDLVVAAGEDFVGLAERGGEAFRRRALEGVADLLFGLAKQAMAGMGDTGGGGLVKSLVSGLGTIFGGGRAAGGGVQAGRVYKINENTPNSEFFAPGVDGMVMTAAQMRANQVRASQASAGGLAISVTPSPYFEVAVRKVAAPVAAQGSLAAYQAGQADIAARQRRAKQSFGVVA